MKPTDTGLADARAIFRRARRAYAPDYVPERLALPRSPRLDTPAARLVRSARRAALRRALNPTPLSLLLP
jgi:hypothetical protein